MGFAESVKKTLTSVLKIDATNSNDQIINKQSCICESISYFYKALEISMCYNIKIYHLYGNTVRIVIEMHFFNINII
jgi:hypothetical protein